MSELSKITAQQMDQKGVCAAPNILNGTPAENKAIFDRMVRQLIAPAYNAMVDAVDTINAQQEAWGQAEAGRVQAEQGRVTAENARVEAENARVAAEKLRVAAENERKIQEDAREAGEGERGLAEIDRATAETAREVAEAARHSAELARDAAEDSRAAAERSRASAETTREANEDTRKSNETTRKNNEISRNNAETVRKANEEQRQGNETDRNLGENRRWEWENNRQVAEEERDTKETDRIASESSRKQAEAARVQAETDRAAAEQARVEAEAERVDTDNGIVAQATEQADAAKAAEEAAAGSATAAAGSAAAAKTSENNAAASAASAQANADAVNPEDINARIAAKADNLYFDETTKLLYLMSEGEVIGDGIAVATGGGSGGGGGGDAFYTAKLTNLLTSRNFSVADDAEVVLKFRYTSQDEDGTDDGPGSGTVKVGGAKVLAFSAAQGENSVNVTKYLTAGTNTIRVEVENSEGTVRSLVYTVTVVTLRLTTTLEALGIYSGTVTFYYTPTGTGTKIVHFLMDGTEIGTATVTSTGRGQTFSIPEQTHGAHRFSAYAEITEGSEVTRSNTIQLGMIFDDGVSGTPAILLDLDRDSADQGETLQARYLAYDPAGETAAVELTVTVDGTEQSKKTLTVPRTAQDWVIQNIPAGTVKLKIRCGTVSAEKTLTVTASSVEIEPVTDALALHFDPSGRSNAEANPGSWTDGSVTASFSGVGFSGSDGWLTDSDGAALLRLLPGASVTIPYQLFASDRREGGATVEVEMATHNCRDYESVVLSCLSGGRGFRIASQFAEIKSEQSELSMQFKEDEKVRVSFAIEPRALHRLIYVYVDGVMCGAVQYPLDDNFQQSPAAGITIGAESSGIDVYRIRIYTRGLGRGEVLDNYVADLPTLTERVAAYQRNDLLDLAGDIQLAKLPATLPYMVVSCAELPQYKGDKKTCEITYVDPVAPERSFTAQTVEINVQGTSSAGYKTKNFKWKLKSGCTYTESGEESAAYQLRGAESVPATTFCMKADVASSEGANNVELVRLYNAASPYKTAAQQADARVRVGIDGKPCVLFWQDGDGKVRFWGKYNFNDDKSSEAVFGLGEGCESWEIKNNTSQRVIFKSADFIGDGWLEDFEGRYPDGNTDPTKLKALCEWIVSTDRSAVTSEADKAARLSKFKTEFEDHFVKAPMLYYYLFTEMFLMVDSRAKNFFPTTYDGTHWMPLPYDFDTALGINNEGQLVFDYDLEDTDTVDGANVFNGQESVLWCNLRDAFPEELKAMYAQLRSGTLMGYGPIVQRFAEHQAVWPERVWNEDSWEKYLEPLENDNDASYLPMLQGSKASQREWWLYNGLRYRDSKYQTGDASANYITLRCYAAGDITVKPYSHIWPRIKYGSYTVTARGKRGVNTTLVCPLENMNDTEVYIYSADRLAEIGDLKALQVGYANFSMAKKLTKLKLGDGASDYSNPNLTGVDVGNNELLTELDVRNCPNLAATVDLSGCTALETVRASGSGIKAVTLPVGGKVHTLDLPGSITNLTVREQKSITSFTCAGYGSLTTLQIEHSPGVPVAAIVTAATNLSRARLIGVSLELQDAAVLRRLAAVGGIDASGGNTDTAVVTGTCHIASIGDKELAQFRTLWPGLTIQTGAVVQMFTVTFKDHDGSTLATASVASGADAVFTGTVPSRASTAQYTYAFTGWSKTSGGAVAADALTNVTADRTVYAVYAATVRSYTVKFYNGSTLLGSASVAYGSDAVYSGAMPAREETAQHTYAFAGWATSSTGAADANALKNITGDRSVYAVFTASVRSYTVRFFQDGVLLGSTSVAYGGSASYTGTPSKETTAQYTYTFAGWSKTDGGTVAADALTGITGDRDVYAVFTASLRSYTVKFYNGSTLLGSASVAYGSDAVYSGTAPSKASDAQYHYSFAGWSLEDGGAANANALKAISGDRTVYAAYSTTLRSYTVKFYQGDTLLGTVQAVYGGVAVYNGATPTKASTAQYSYSFSGWSLTAGGSADASATMNITGDRSVYACFSATLQKYTVRFYNGSTLLAAVSNVPYGGSASYTGDTPSNGENYEFTGWNPAPTGITGDTDCFAVFVYTKLPGKVWTQSNITSAALNVITYANGLWVAGGGGIGNTSYGLYYSADGKNWVQSNITDRIFSTVDYANGVWVAASKTGDIYTSEDGMTWTKNSVTSNACDFAVYGGGLWVAYAGGHYYSTDGKNWTKNSALHVSFVDVAYGGNLWCAASRTGIYYSTDGKTWTQSNITSKVFGAVAYVNGMWIASSGTVTGHHGIYYSTDGKTWTQSNVTSGAFKSVDHGNGLYVAGSKSYSSGSWGIYYSADGKTWTQSNVTSGEFKVAYANGIWVAAGSGLYYSLDGKTWIKSNVTSGSFYDAAFANGLWVAGGNTGLYYSE